MGGVEIGKILPWWSGGLEGGHVCDMVGLWRPMAWCGNFWAQRRGSHPLMSSVSGQSSTPESESRHSSTPTSGSACLLIHGKRNRLLRIISYPLQTTITECPLNRKNYIHLPSECSCIEDRTIPKAESHHRASRRRPRHKERSEQRPRVHNTNQKPASLPHIIRPLAFP